MAGEREVSVCCSNQINLQTISIFLSTISPDLFKISSNNSNRFLLFMYQKADWSEAFPNHQTVSTTNDYCQFNDGHTQMIKHSQIIAKIFAIAKDFFILQAFITNPIISRFTRTKSNTTKMKPVFTTAALNHKFIKDIWHFAIAK